MKLTNLFFLILSLNCILALSTGIKGVEKIPKEIKPYSLVDYDKNFNNYFKFNHYNDSTIVGLSFIELFKDIEAIYLTDPNNIRQKMEKKN